MKIDEIDFSNGFRSSHVVNFEKLNILSTNIFEFKFYQGGINWKHKLLPIEISENNSQTVIDLLIYIYKNHYVFIKTTCMFR